MDIVLRATAIYLLVWLVTRGLGKRELAQMSPFELVLLVIFGDLIQQGVTQDDRSLTGAGLAVLTIAFWVAVFDLVTFRSKRAKRLFEGLPVVIVNEGEPVNAAMDYERIGLDEVKAAARSQGIADLSAVRLGVLEPDGMFSFILYDGPSRQQRFRKRDSF